MSLFYQLTEEVIRREAAGKSLIKLHIGSTNLKTPEPAVEAARLFLQASRSSYGSAAGQPGLRAALAKREGRPVEDIVVGPGSKQLIFALAAISNRKRFVTAAPYWPAYRLIAEQLRMEFVAIETTLENRWSLPEYKSSADDFIVLCNPVNPTSTLIEPTGFATWITEAKRRGGLVVVDEAYRGIAFREQPLWDAVRVRSFSKEFNMEGFRIGYVVSGSDISAQLIAFNQISITCVPPFIQSAAEACIVHEKELLSAHRAIWQRRTAALARGLRQIGFEFVDPDSGMFLFARHPAIRDSNAFTLGLLDRGVSVSPGSGFGNFDSYIRLSASEEPDELLKACDIIDAYLKIAA